MAWLQLPSSKINEAPRQITMFGIAQLFLPDCSAHLDRHRTSLIDESIAYP